MTGKTLSNIHLHLCRNRCGDHLVVSGKILGLVDDHVEVSEVVDICKIVDTHKLCNNGDFCDLVIITIRGDKDVSGVYGILVIQHASKRH